MTDQMSEMLAGVYRGDLVASDRNDPIETTITVEALSDVLVRVIFEYQGKEISMRAILSEGDGDIHMIIQEKVTERYILNGVRGFLCQKPNVHGGYINELDGFYFHILFNHFSGPYQEYYFFGRPVPSQALAG